MCFSRSRHRLHQDKIAWHTSIVEENGGREDDLQFREISGLLVRHNHQMHLHLFTWIQVLRQNEHVTYQILPEFYQSFTRVLPEFYQSFTRVLPEFYHSFTTVLPEFYLSFTWVLPEFYLSFTRVLPEFYHSFTRVLPEFYQSFTRVLPEFYQSFTWVLCFTVLHVHIFIHFSSKWDLIYPAQNPSSTSPWWAGGNRFMKPC